MSKYVSPYQMSAASSKPTSSLVRRSPLQNHTLRPPVPALLDANSIPSPAFVEEDEEDDKAELSSSVSEGFYRLPGNAHAPGAHAPGAHAPGAHAPGAHAPGAHAPSLPSPVKVAQAPSLPSPIRQPPPRLTQALPKIATSFNPMEASRRRLGGPRTTAPPPPPVAVEAKDPTCPVLDQTSTEAANKALTLINAHAWCMNTSSAGQQLLEMMAYIIYHRACRTIILCSPLTKDSWVTIVDKYSLDAEVFSFKQLTAPDTKHPDSGLVDKVHGENNSREVSYEPTGAFDAALNGGIFLVVADAHLGKTPSGAVNKAVRALTAQIVDSDNSYHMLISDKFFDAPADVSAYLRLCGIYRESELYIKAKEAKEFLYPGMQQIINFCRAVDAKASDAILGTVSKIRRGGEQYEEYAKLTRKDCSTIMRELYKAVLQASLTVNVSSAEENLELATCELLLNKAEALIADHNARVVISCSYGRSLQHIAGSLAPYEPSLLEGEDLTDQALLDWTTSPRRILLLQQGNPEQIPFPAGTVFHVLSMNSRRPGTFMHALCTVI